jgi:hypothetical protein
VPRWERRVADWANTKPPSGPEVSVGAILREAAAVYRVLAARSILVAALVYAGVNLLLELAVDVDDAGRAAVVATAALVGSLGAEILVQGALVQAVHDIRERGRARSAAELLVGVAPYAIPFLGALLLWMAGVFVGLLLLIVPGVILAARWSLIAPVIVLERRRPVEALARSNELVRGRTGRVLLLLLATAAISAALGLGLAEALDATPGSFASWLASVIAASLTAPYGAHVFTVLYFRLIEPERPVLPAR